MTEFPALRDAQGKLDHARQELASVMAEAKASGGVYDMDQIKSVPGDKTAKLEWIRAKNAELVPLKAEVDSLLQVKLAADNTKGFEGGTQGGSDTGADGDTKGFKNIGDSFVKSVAYTDKGKSAHLDIDLKTLFQRTAGWSPESTRSGLVTLSPQIPAPSVVDHLPTIPVSQALYKYMEETTYTNSAVETDEATVYQEAVLALTERSVAVQKIAVWIPVTDEQLEDEPAAAAYVNARLSNMLKQKLDLQVLVGTGTNTVSNQTQILGTTNVSGIQTQAAGQGNSGVGGFSLLDDSYKLFTSIRTVGFAEPSVAFVRPSYWQGVALLKTADGIYIYGSPTSGAPSVLWGVPVVQTMAAPSGKLVAGDYANYGFLGVRRGMDVQTTNSHASHFINGEQAIRADMRVVMVHVRPTAFGTVTGLS